MVSTECRRQKSCMVNHHLWNRRQPTICRSFGLLATHLFLVLISLSNSHAWLATIPYASPFRLHLDPLSMPGRSTMRWSETSRLFLSSSSTVSNGTSISDGLDMITASFTEQEFPVPTANGGFSHTNSSRSKISAANKGNVPWNKGIARSEEVRAKISAGVRRRNRANFLKQLEEQGITEEEYNRKKEEKAAAKRARRTEKGGYRATPETREKLSRIMKEKVENGEIKPRKKVNPSKVRRGFKHTEETRRKISEKLRQKWAEDAEYRERMEKSRANISPETRLRISENLRQKWKDPAFRDTMLEKLDTGGGHSEERKRKISDAIKAKWQTEEYKRNIAVGLQRRAAARPAKPKVIRTPLQPSKKKKTHKKAPPPRPVVRARRRRRAPYKKAPAINIVPIEPIVVSDACKPKVVRVETDDDAPPPPVEEEQKEKVATKRAPRKKTKTKKRGDVDLMREERRDLYDLLYDSKFGDGGDEDDSSLDNFDPYGLESN